MVKYFTSSALAFFVFLGASSVFATEAGKISFAVGTVEILKNNSWQKAKSGDSVFEKNRIRTGKNSTAIVLLKSRAQLKLKPESDVELSSVGAATVIEVGGGAIFSKVDNRKSGESFQINALTMVAGVRGTEFFFSYGKKKDGKSDMWLCVNEGLVNVKDTASKSEVDVKQGEGIIIPANKPIPKPKAYYWTKKLNWNMDASSGDVVDGTNIKSAYTDLLRQNYD